MTIDNIEQVIEMHNEARSLHTDRLSEIEKWDAFYYGDHYEGLGFDTEEESEERYISNAPENVVNVAYAILTSSPLRIRVRPERSTERTNKKSSEIEAWAHGALHVNTLRERTNPFKKVAFDVLQRGWGVLGSFWNQDLEGDDNKEFSEFPGVIRYVNPRNFFWIPGSYGKDRIQAYSYYCRGDHVRYFYNASLQDKRGRKRLTVRRDGELRNLDYSEEDATTERFIDLWYHGSDDRIYNATIWGETWIKRPTPMPYYKDLPYTWIPCIPTTSDQLHLQSLPLLNAIKWQVVYSERVMNRILHILANYSDPTWIHPEDVAIDKSIGATIPYHVGDVHGPNSVRIVPPVGAPNDLWQTYGVIQRQLEEGSFSSAFTFAQGSAESGVAGQLMTSNDRVRLNTPKQSMEIGYSSALQKLFTTCSLASTTTKMYVFQQGKEEVSLSGKELQGWRVDTILDVELPNDMIRNINMAATIKQAGLPIPERDIAQDYLKREQPEFDRLQMLRDDFWKNPLVQQAALLKIAAEFGLKDEMEALIAPRKPQPDTGQLTNTSPMRGGELPPTNLPGGTPEGPPMPGGLGPRPAVAPGPPQGMNPQDAIPPARIMRGR